MNNWNQINAVCVAQVWLTPIVVFCFFVFSDGPVLHLSVVIFILEVTQFLPSFFMHLDFRHLAWPAKGKDASLVYSDPNKSSKLPKLSKSHVTMPTPENISSGGFLDPTYNKTLKFLNWVFERCSLKRMIQIELSHKRVRYKTFEFSHFLSSSFIQFRKNR